MTGHESSNRCFCIPAMRGGRRPRREFQPTSSTGIEARSAWCLASTVAAARNAKHTRTSEIELKLCGYASKEMNSI